MSTADAIAAIVALTLSVVSIGMSIWTALIQRETRRLWRESQRGSTP